MKKSTITKLCAAIALFGVNAMSFAQTTTSFSYTGSTQTYTVAAGVSYLIIDMEGATGGFGQLNGIGGAGARLQCVMAVTPGSVLEVNVGGQGDTFLMSTVRLGGFNGGGDGNNYGAGGGGGTDIRMGGTGLANRVAVAGGGGGGGYNCGSQYGGCGGLNGGNGIQCSMADATGGTQFAGGLPGWGTPAAGPGTLGAGGDCSLGAYGGAGGGGGYYGGGGGGQYSGGGGGSSYADTMYCTTIIIDSNVNTTGHGRMMIRDSIVASTLGVASVNDNASMSIYPNPGNGLLNIKWQGQQTGMADVVVADMTGRVVFRSKLNMKVASAEQQLDMKGLGNGMYMINVKSPTINYSSKLMIQQ